LQREGPGRLTRNGRGHDTRSLCPWSGGRDHQCEGRHGGGDETHPRARRDPRSAPPCASSPSSAPVTPPPQPGTGDW